MEQKDIQYIVLHRGMMLNDFELQYAEIYPAEVFEKVPQHTLIGMILGGWLYRGSEQEVLRVKEITLAGMLGKIDKRTTEPEKQRQIKELKASTRPVKK
jgi:hypothetical protein